MEIQCHSTRCGTSGEAIGGGGRDWKKEGKGGNVLPAQSCIHPPSRPTLSSHKSQKRRNHPVTVARQTELNVPPPLNGP